jgi:hypothetical protein
VGIRRRRGSKSEQRWKAGGRDLHELVFLEEWAIFGKMVFPEELVFFEEFVFLEKIEILSKESPLGADWNCVDDPDLCLWDPSSC